MTLRAYEPQHSTKQLSRETLKQLRKENFQIADNYLQRGYYLHEEIIRIKEIQHTLRAGGIL